MGAGDPAVGTREGRPRVHDLILVRPAQHPYGRQADWRLSTWRPVWVVLRAHMKRGTGMAFGVLGHAPGPARRRSAHPAGTHSCSLCVSGARAAF